MFSKDEYRALAAAGVDGMTMFQETYNPTVYAAYHPSGPKRIFPNRIDAFERDGATTRLRLSGHVPLSLSLRHPAGCSVSLDGRRLGAVRVADGLHHYATSRDGTETLTIGCP